MLTVISLKQEYGGHAMRAALTAAGSHSGGYMAKVVIVVDEDIDPSDLNDVLWAVVSRADFDTSVSIVKGCWGSRLDAALPPDKREKGDLTHSIMIINACKPFHWRDRFPPVNKAGEELRTKIIEKWGDIIPLLKAESR